MKRGRKAVNQAGISRVDEAWLDRLLPTRCLLCEAPGSPGLDLCPGCVTDLPWIDTACGQCGLPLPEHSRDAICGVCIRKPPPFHRTLAPLKYSRPVDGLINRFKHQHSLTTGRALARLLTKSIRQVDVDLPELLIPIPLHRWRYWRRGFNQAQLLARDLSAELGLPMARALARIRHTPHQQGLKASTRRANLNGAFSIRAGTRLPASVALIDDVMTTGATVSECARVLRQHGADSVSVWCIARTPQPGG